MKKGDILGHEFMGEVVEVGREVTNLKIGDRVVVPFTIACGRCFFCKKGSGRCCDNSNPNAWMAEKLYGYSRPALFGYSHLYGGYAGGQAEYVRVPFADVGPIKIPDGLPDEQVLFLSDIFPTGYMAAENCNIQPRRHRRRLGLRAGRPVRHPERLPARCRARHRASTTIPTASGWPATGKAETLNYEEVDVFEALEEMTGGRGPDSCIDAVGHGGARPQRSTPLYDRVKAALCLTTDRPHALRQAIQACRKGGTVSIPGVYGGLLDKFPIGAAFAKGLTLQDGPDPRPPLPEAAARAHPARRDRPVVRHHPPAARWTTPREGYKTFRNEQDECIKVVLKP